MTESAGDVKTKEILTKQEMEVFLLVMEGKSSREVAGELHLSERTISSHLLRIFKKLNANNRIQAFREAVKLGIIEI